MSEKKSNKSFAQIFVMTVSILVNLSIVVMAALSLFDVYDLTDVFVPLLGVSNLCAAYSHWNINRKTAYFCLGTAAFIFICACVVLFL